MPSPSDVRRIAELASAFSGVRVDALHDALSDLLEDFEEEGDALIEFGEPKDDLAQFAIFDLNTGEVNIGPVTVRQLLAREEQQLTAELTQLTCQLRRVRSQSAK